MRSLFVFQVICIIYLFIYVQGKYTLLLCSYCWKGINRLDDWVKFVCWTIHLLLLSPAELGCNGIETLMVDATEARPERAVCRSILCCSRPRGEQIVCPGRRLHWLVALLQPAGGADIANWIDSAPSNQCLNNPAILSPSPLTGLQNVCANTRFSSLSPPAWFVLLGQSGWLSCLRGTVSSAQQVYWEKKWSGGETVAAWFVRATGPSGSAAVWGRFLFSGRSLFTAFCLWAEWSCRFALIASVTRRFVSLLEWFVFKCLKCLSLRRVVRFAFTFSTTRRFFVSVLYGGVDGGGDRL